MMQEDSPRFGSFPSPLQRVGVELSILRPAPQRMGGSMLLIYAALGRCFFGQPHPESPKDYSSQNRPSSEALLLANRMTANGPEASTASIILSLSLLLSGHPALQGTMGALAEHVSHIAVAFGQ